ncbi:MAG TPA: MBL fold metallo-hydrolase, partial [Deinococcales bacterium]|nr:MBL fold metallo-hydrolase [Deinococcales bacterium]
MALPEPASLTEGLWYLPAPVNTFIIEGPEGTSILVDTGQDKTYARRLLRTSRDVLNLEPAAIINTHAHSDHFGGNSWLLRRLPDVRVYAPAGAATVIREPVLQPLGLWHGATPLPELLKKWTHGKPSRVDTELGPGTLEVAGVPLTFIDAAGHARQQLAVQYRDVLIAADGFAGLELLEKYPLTFSHDPGLMLQSFERLGQSSARLAVPGHGSPGSPAELAA